MYKIIQFSLIFPFSKAKCWVLLCVGMGRHCGEHCELPLTPAAPEGQLPFYRSGVTSKPQGEVRVTGQFALGGGLSVELTGPSPSLLNNTCLR